MAPDADRPNSAEYELAITWNSWMASWARAIRVADESELPPPVTSSLKSTPSSQIDL